MADAMIRVPAHVRDRLAVLAEAQGTSIRSLIQRFAESTLTQAERDEKADQVKEYIATHFGVVVTEADEEAMQRMIDASVNGAETTDTTDCRSDAADPPAAEAA
ncbi:hypothetical protein [Streptomyces oceani]|uniref:hypothetical protein n=1 Tax=Streptomyces oceani TaxID=1075402 RepID=UPI0008730595|nr:hypothetical protein [Streptomyces oceani]